MNLVWVVISIIVIGYIGERIVFSKDRLPAALGDMFLTGWEFMLAGALVGPMGLSIISQERLELLDPFIALGLGWAGLIFGSQLRLEDLRKVDPGMLKLTALQAVVVWGGLFPVMFACSLVVLDISWTESLTFSLIVAAAGAISSPTALSLMSSRFPRSKSAAIRQLMLVATLDLAPALLAIGLVFCFFPPEQGGAFSLGRGGALLGYSALVALALAGLFRFFGREELKPEENLAVLIGFIVFMSGTAFYLNLSPLFLSLLTGVILANVLERDDKMFSLLYSTEKPFYVMLLLVTGMWWQRLGLGVWAMAFLLVGARLWLKREAFDRASEALPEKRRTPPGAGMALAAQGALAPAIGLNFLLVYPGEGPEAAFGVIVAAMIMNEILAPFLIRRVMSGEEEKA
ncbi:MAG: hypothetical protein ACNS63_11020 [Candidatus Nitrospinota bacterium M3_3B_026]